MAGRVCPVWMGYLLISPLRRLFQKPERILRDHVGDGDTVLDIGPGLGFCTLPMARMVGPSGKVIAVDVQEGMIRGLRRRARRKGLDSRIDTVVCEKSDLLLDAYCGSIDFALAMEVVHEVSRADLFFGQLHQAIRSGGKLLVHEPRGHVGSDDFARELRTAKEAGFIVIRTGVEGIDRTALLERAGPSKGADSDNRRAV